MENEEVHTRYQPTQASLWPLEMSQINTATSKAPSLTDEFDEAESQQAPVSGLALTGRKMEHR